MIRDSEELKKIILESLDHIEYVDTPRIPRMELYMDQVRTFMEDALSGSKRRGEDKILTKTMINNYAKNDLLPPPDNKKYSREHIIVLIFIYYFKQILSMNDIRKLLTPLFSEFFDANGDKNPGGLDGIYEAVFNQSSEERDSLKSSMLQLVDLIDEKTVSLPKDKEYDKQFYLICSLLFDIYARKKIVESLIDKL